MKNIRDLIVETKFHKLVLNILILAFVSTVSFFFATKDLTEQFLNIQAENLRNSLDMTFNELKDEYPVIEEPDILLKNYEEQNADFEILNSKLRHIIDEYNFDNIVIGIENEKDPTKFIFVAFGYDEGFDTDTHIYSNFYYDNDGNINNDMMTLGPYSYKDNHYFNILYPITNDNKVFVSLVIMDHDNSYISKYTKAIFNSLEVNLVYVTLLLSIVFIMLAIGGNIYKFYIKNEPM
jgi:hypothetical protein